MYIADGYNNRRVIVFDADTGAYKRHWGAYGKRPTDLRLLEDKEGLIADPAEFYLPAAPPPPQWLSVHCVRVSKDGLVVCVRPQPEPNPGVPQGRHVRQGVLRRAGHTGRHRVRARVARGQPPVAARPANRPHETAGFGAPSTVAFSSDPEQRYLYVGDNQNHKIRIFRRRDLQLLGSFPTNTGANHYLTVDSKGNIYNSGLQKFVFKGVPTLNELLNRTAGREPAAR